MKNGKVIFAIVLFVCGLACFIVNAKFEIVALLPALILFAVGFFLLIKGGDWFVDGASAIAEKFKVPEILIGATVVDRYHASRSNGFRTGGSQRKRSDIIR